MKRLSIVIFLFFVVISLMNAQNEKHALIVSKEISGGTARSLSMGGSFGALGGDMSVAGTNPAGLAIFRKSVLTFTPGIYYVNAESDYLDETNEDYEYKLTLDNVGYAWVYRTGNSNGWVSTTLAYSYNKLMNYNQNIIIGPVIANSSLLDEFAAAYGQDPGLQVNYPPEYYDLLAYETYLIDNEPNLPEWTQEIYDTTGMNYYSVFEVWDPKFGQTQQKTIIRKGQYGEHNLSFASNFDNKLYIGASLGIRKFKYSQTTDHFETDSYDQFDFKENVEINGTGYNLKIGLLASPFEYVRIGAAFHLPTNMHLNQNQQNTMSSYILDTLGYSNQYEASSRDYDVPYKYSYKTLTPLKALFSLGFIIGKYGLLNFDYEHVDYTKMRLRSSDDSFTDLNDYIKDNFQKTSNIKIGGEFNLGMVALRAGYSYYGSPYKKKSLDESTSILSTGIGIRNKNYFFDLGIMNYKITESHTLYKSIYYPQENGEEEYKADINLSTVKILATIGFKF